MTPTPRHPQTDEMTVSDDTRPTYFRELASQGYFIVRQGFSTQEIAEMSRRLDEIIVGQHAKTGRRFQADTDSGRYEEVQKSEVGYGGADVSYRKIADLEFDEVFLAKIQSPWIREICAHVLGSVTSVMRVTMMNKAAMGGTPLPWHQDISLDWPTTVQPKLAMWFSLDKASAASGSIQIVRRSHRHGLIGRGHMLPADLEARYVPPDDILTVETDPGDVLFFHAGLLHRSGTNATGIPRRAVNVILMPGTALHTKRQKNYPVLHGTGELTPAHVAQLTAID